MESRSKVVVLGAVLALLLIYDGIATYIGVNVIGHPEGNPIIRWLMEVIGVGPALFFSRIPGLLIVWWIVVFQCLKNFQAIIMFSVLNVSYVTFSMVPWTLLIIDSL